MKMTNEFADAIIIERLNFITNTLAVKAKEYVRNEDRMHNFNVASAIKNTTREQIIDDFMLKHYVSYRDMLIDINNGKLPTEEYVNEKIGDIINYLILFEMSIKQKIYENNTRVV